VLGSGTPHFTHLIPEEAWNNASFGIIMNVLLDAIIPNDGAMGVIEVDPTVNDTIRRILTD